MAERRGQDKKPKIPLGLKKYYGTNGPAEKQRRIECAPTTTTKRTVIPPGGKKKSSIKGKKRDDATSPRKRRLNARHNRAREAFKETSIRHGAPSMDHLFSS